MVIWILHHGFVLETMFDYSMDFVKISIKNEKNYHVFGTLQVGIIVLV